MARLDFGGRLRLARWGSLVLLALAGCGGSGGGGAGDVAALDAAVAGAPCPTAFGPVVQASAESAVPVSSKAATAVAAVYVGLSQCPMDAQRNITIGDGGGTQCGPNVLIDQSFTGASALGKITILASGKLAVPASFDAIELDTAGISVAGAMSIGTAQCPVGSNNPASHMTVRFTGTPVPSSGPTDIGSGSDKGIEVQSGGSLRLYGTRGVAPKGVNWTYLSAPAGPAAYTAANAPGIGAAVVDDPVTLHLAADVSSGAGAWRNGDWIVVATTSFSPFESEFVQIANVVSEGSGSKVTLAQPLQDYHFGGADPGLPTAANYGADKTTNFGVDERAEVGLISRNITFTTDTPYAAASPTDQTNHWGGEIRVLAGFGEVSIQGVELEKFGKARLGSYPIHFHMDGTPTGTLLVDSNSIHHSYNKCVTVHMTQGIAISNTVCARAIGHLFYEETAQEQNTKFVGNLGIGAMSNSFGLDPMPTAPTQVKAYWQGDNLALLDNYNGLNVPNMDNQSNPVHGGCYGVNAQGGLVADGPPPPCQAISTSTNPLTTGKPLIYVEQATGFWISNPSSVLQGNSIAGCQGQGKGYWYVPPTAGNQQFEVVGGFMNNRVHGCFDGLFGESDEGVISQQLFPRVGGSETGLSVISHFTGLTATRIRNRGVWMRPTWNVLDSGRFATSRDAVSLISSGGLDGNAPGIWALLQDSVLVGLSTNNVDRWGPCPQQRGEGPGCVDWNKNANDFQFKGYQMPVWNSAGYMIYDGPVRIIHDHFVNYLADISSLLTAADAGFLNSFVAYSKPTTKTYEGDAALGWFQSNFSAYPTATVTRNLSFDNVTLRHQIYTDKVNLADFVDGDKNTAILDLDGTLSGLQVVDTNGNPLPGEHPISLNNLEFNHTDNAMDECLSTGQQDTQYEGRPTSIMSPANTATLEFEALWPGQFNLWWQNLTFTKDSLDAGAHQAMTLLGRNGKGVWEPKVASGTGYSITAAVTTRPGQAQLQPGIPSIVHLSFTDAVKSNMSAANPFYVRVGICYSNAQGRPPNGNFTITRGYKSLGGNGINAALPDYRPYYTQLIPTTSTRNCDNLDNNNNVVGSDGVPVFLNLDPATGCPAVGLAGVVPGAPVCPAGSTLVGDFCQFPTSPLTTDGVSALSDISNPDGSPKDLSKYFFDKTTGMLFFYVQQTSPNAHGVMPLGSCHNPIQAGDDPACPGASDLETYFGCPAQGCVNYAVVLNDPSYVPGPSACAALAPNGNLYDPGTGFALNPPPQATFLAKAGPARTASPKLTTQAIPAGVAPYQHWVATDPPTCDTTTTPVAAASASAVTPPTATPTARLFDPARWLGPAVATRLAALARDPLAGLRIHRPVDMDPLMLSQICTARGG